MIQRCPNGTVPCLKVKKELTHNAFQFWHRIYYKFCSKVFSEEGFPYVLDVN